MSRHSEDSKETRLLLRRFLFVGVVVPLVGCLAALSIFLLFDIERNRANIRFSVLLIWLTSIFGLGVSLFATLRNRPRRSESVTPVTRLSRLDWEAVGDRRSATEVLRALCYIPIFTFGFLYTCNLFYPIFSTPQQMRLVLGVSIVSTIFVCTIVSLRTRSKKIG